MLDVIFDHPSAALAAAERATPHLLTAVVAPWSVRWGVSTAQTVARTPGCNITV